MLGSSVLLLLFETVRFLVVVRRGSWLFGPGFLRKIAHLALPGLLYALVMGLSNVSLNMTNVNFHNLLRLTSIVFVVAGAWLFLRETPSDITLLCCAGLVAGSLYSSWSYSSSSSSSSWSSQTAAPVVLTLASAAAQAALFISLRWAMTRLGRDLGVFEAISVTMTVASLALLPLVLALDSGGFARLAAASPTTHGLVAAGVFITTAFQTIHVALQSMALATTIGILGMCVIVPQEIISLLFNKPKPVWDLLHIFGYVISPLFAVTFAVYKLIVLHYDRKDAARLLAATNAEAGQPEHNRLSVVIND